MNYDVAWLDMIDRLEEGTVPSNTMVLAGLLANSVGKVTSIRTFEKGVLVNKQDISPNVIG